MEKQELFTNALGENSKLNKNSSNMLCIDDFLSSI